MESLYLLIPLSVMAVVVAVLVFFWMNKSGQFDDDQGPAWSILLDDDRPVQAKNSTEKKAEKLNETGDKIGVSENETPPESH
ncbi:cbb3-type cytochrome oxidase assembly protein CcoS [Granulosicoccus antarcticus]|uniref:Cytochrome oxidase maturation protein cbb3-type n=1 Tax=Granulosicoccus antarcticus IMCC3135 TaxID=1192854 RepID=A0A2Z2NX62_9GAMM|nr:cbb3-type cytochrome oxidase assembly protein CcoS [Granulosicoccus antarcticus]ASJ76022.1 hypothetical protein IMCC3135_29865 [Granulosicoccus antarcticus IMCC3135]